MTRRPANPTMVFQIYQIFCAKNIFHDTVESGIFFIIGNTILNPLSSLLPIKEFGKDYSIKMLALHSVIAVLIESPKTVIVVIFE